MSTAFQVGSAGSRMRGAFLALAMAGGLCARAATIDVGGSVVATTDYVFRGLTQSGRKAAVQADLHLQTPGGWFGGAWGSFAGSEPDFQSRSEVNLYLGRVWTLTPDWTTSTHYARYLYPDGRNWIRYYYGNYDELQMSVSYQDRVTLSLALAPDIRRYSPYGLGRQEGKQLSYEASLRQPVWRNLALTAGLGYYDLKDLFDETYWAWSAGAEAGFERLRVTLTRFGAGEGARQLFGRQTADGHWALTAAWQF